MPHPTSSLHVQAVATAGTSIFVGNSTFPHVLTVANV